MTKNFAYVHSRLSFEFQPSAVVPKRNSIPFKFLTEQRCFLVVAVVFFFLMKRCGLARIHPNTTVIYPNKFC